VEVVGHRFGQRFLFAVRHPGIAAMDHPHVAGLDATHRFLDATPHQVEEGGDLARQVHPDPELLARGQEAGREVGPVAERLGAREDAVAGLRLDPGSIVQGAVDGADGETQALGDLSDPRRLLPLAGFLPAPGHPPPFRGEPNPASPSVGRVDRWERRQRHAKF
jgi:hypothetical protein